MPRKNKEESPTLHMRLLRRILPMALATVALLPLLLIPLFVLWPAASSLFTNFIKGRLHLFATKENWGFQSLLLSKPHVYFRNKGHSDQSSSSHGVSFQRTIENFPTNSTFQLFFDKEKCQDEDSFGNSHCHYDWGDHVTADYSIFVNETLTESAFVEGTFKARRKILMLFSSAMFYVKRRFFYKFGRNIYLIFLS